MEAITLGYLAGILDGEGTITLSRQSAGGFRYPCISVTSTTPAIIDFLKETCGGVVCQQKTYKEHHLPSQSWRVIGTNVFPLLELVLPFMLEPEKVRRGRLILASYRAVTPRNGKYSLEGLAKKLQFEEQFFHPSTP